MKVIGIDPGKTGALTLLNDSTIEVFRFKDCTEREIRDLFKYVKNFDIKIAGLEKVHSMKKYVKKNGKIVEQKQGVKSVWTFAQNYGFLRGCLLCFDIPFIDIPPKKWQKFYQLAKDKKESKTQFKKRIKEKAQNLFPQIKVTMDMADSMLIAYYTLINLGG